MVIWVLQLTVCELCPLYLWIGMNSHWTAFGIKGVKSFNTFCLFLESVETSQKMLPLFDT